LTASGPGFIGNFTVIPTSSLKLCEAIDWFIQEILMEHVDMAALILSLDPQEFCLPTKPFATFEYDFFDGFVYDENLGLCKNPQLSPVIQ
jgi:hypothetical protein